MKTGLDDASGYQTRQAVRTGLFQFIEGLCNCRRLHSAIGYMTPMQKEQLRSGRVGCNPCPPNRVTVKVSLPLPGVHPRC